MFLALHFGLFFFWLTACYGSQTLWNMLMMWENGHGNIIKWKSKLSAYPHFFQLAKIRSLVYTEKEGHTSKRQQQSCLSGRIISDFYFSLCVFLTFPKFLHKHSLFVYWGGAFNVFERIRQSITQWFNLSDVNAFQQEAPPLPLYALFLVSKHCFYRKRTFWFRRVASSCVVIK